MTKREEFIAVYQENIQRRGADRLLEWLDSDASDFFTAPSSTRFHGAYEGGLVEHSLNVYECLKDYLNRPRTKELYGMDYTPETIAVTALLHDICKVGFYAVDYRNAKNEQGVWEKVPYYTVRDTLPYGHGEKSVYMIQSFMRLTRDEAFAWAFPATRTRTAWAEHWKCFRWLWQSTWRIWKQRIIWKGL